jgi:hypothetical protein
MATQKIPLYIPVFINSATYTPARVLPRLYFYNGQVNCESWYMSDGNNASREQTAFPYFDHYNVTGSQFPTTNSKSLLFNNEAAAYGQVPDESLYTTYWEKYIEFLYNPKTRVLNCSAIIPLADYFHMELNDIVNFRGNYWHLRAINDYSLKTGECNLQLVGPVIPDVFDKAPPVPPAPPAQASSSVSWSYSESAQNGTFTIYDNATTIATLTANGNGNSQISESHYITASLVPVSYPSSGSVTMSINVNGGTTLAVTGSTNTTISASFLVGSAQTYNITGSIIWNSPPTLSIEYLVVAGGGGPGSYNGAAGPTRFPGGGGAGGFQTGSATLNNPTSLSVVVGTGGNINADGVASAFNALTSSGGGRGGNETNYDGNSGGSGGGGNTSGLGGAGIAGQGNNGCAGYVNNPRTIYFGGAGGGAGSAAGGGNGFDPGVTKAWLDGNQYAGGGNGVVPDVSGSLTSGSGGNTNSGIGKDGIVKIRYAGSGSQATGGIITYSGSYTYHTFISAGTFSYP